jgi:Calcineurin-like phosphoesterase
VTAGNDGPNIQDRKIYPDMTHWFSPGLLTKLLWKVVVSDMFGQYADRRLIVAALDTVPPDELVARANLTNVLHKDANGALWIDFAADLGDGFDSTYAIALLLAREILQVDGHALPRGQALIFGGDEVYPTATTDAYRFQLGAPYALAMPDSGDTVEEGIPVFAMPGNHDWYDGLVNFMAFFGREKPWHMGGWRSRQRRSYFALQLTEKWWLWSTDIQLADNMDQPQADYFKLIAERMPHGARIILCSAEPGWLYTHTNAKSFGIMDYAGRIAQRANRDLSVPILLSGDTHHYSRYATADGVQFITSGGAGAFLHPTHQLADEISLDWQRQRLALSLKTDPQTGAATATPACYPSREISKSLLWRNLWYAFTNWDFTILMGAIYALFAVALNLRPHWDAYIITFLIFAGTLLAYTRYQEKLDAPVIYISSLLHGLAHTCAVIILTICFAAYNDTLFLPTDEWWDVWRWLIPLVVEVGIVGGIVGAFLFGLNLLITCRWFNMNTNDAFSALRLNTYRHFLRICIKSENEVIIYPIRLDKIPSRDDWQKNPQAQPDKQDQPVFLPREPLDPHLIEKPIRVVLKAS